MATYYLDFVNGNDTSTGADWANAWKTLNNGATAARIAPGDTIRIAKTADPTSIGNATWTNKSAIVTLASAQTTNIYLDGAWTAANSGTTTTTTTRKEGTNASSITTAATTATTTKYAYLTVGGASGLNLSSYDAISFWIQNATVAVVANNYQIKLCSDTTGDTAVDTFDIPAIASNGAWVPFTLTRSGGGSLGSAIKSIALYTGSVNPGNSRNLFIDNVIGCTESGLSLTSLISKNSAAHGGTDTWHGLQYINGTTVGLGNNNADSGGTASIKGYYTTGTSPATVTTYIRPTFKFNMQSSTSGSAQPLQDSGTAGNLITYSGGWNTSTNTQDGSTWIDGQNGVGIGLNCTSKDFLSFTRINMTRFTDGIWIGSTARNGYLISDMIVCNGRPGVYSLKNSNITVTWNNGTGAPIFIMSGDVFNNLFDISFLNNSNPVSLTVGVTSNNFKNLISYNCPAGTISSRNIFQNLDLRATGNFALDFGIDCNIVINNLTLIDNTSGGVVSTANNGVPNVAINKLTVSSISAVGSISGTLQVKQTNATSSQLIGSAANTLRLSNYPALTYNAVNNVVTDNRSYWRYGNALSQTTTRHTASGVAWQINITDTSQSTNMPIYFPIARVACNANKLVTVKAWVKLSHATDIGAKLMIQAYEIAGVSADVTASKSADTNWEELTITFTPTIAGVAQIYVQGYWLANLADESIYVDDVQISQA